MLQTPSPPPALHSIVIEPMDAKKHGIAITRILSTYPGSVLAGCAIGHEQVFVAELKQGQEYPLLMIPKDRVTCSATGPIAAEDSPEAKKPSIKVRVIRP